MHSYTVNSQKTVVKLIGTGKKVKKISYFVGTICRQANEYKEYIQLSQFSDRDTVSNNQLEEIERKLDQSQHG